MTIRNVLPLLLLLVVTSLPAGAYAQAPVTYEAEYRAKAAGMSATAKRKLEQLPDNGYLLSQALVVRVLGAKLGEIEETSRFSISDGQLIPEFYEYDQSGVSRRHERVQFDWSAGVATSSEDDEEWQLPIDAGIVDKLNFQLLLRDTLAKGEIDELEIRMVDTDEIETHLYRVTGTEQIETELGMFDCIRVERIRDPGSKRRTIFWLARDWNMLLVRFEQISGSGSETELSLEKAVIGNQVVTPLP